MGIKWVKIKGRGRDRWRIILRLSVVERWKCKKKVIVESSGEKWETGKWRGRWCGSTEA